MQKSKRYSESEMLSLLSCEETINRNCWTPLKIPYNSDVKYCIWVGLTLLMLPIWIIFMCSGSYFFNSIFNLQKQESRTRGTETWNTIDPILAMKCVLKNHFADMMTRPGRTMFSLGWIFLWLVGRERIKGFNLSGRGFHFSC